MVRAEPPFPPPGQCERQGCTAISTRDVRVGKVTFWFCSRHAGTYTEPVSSRLGNIYAVPCPRCDAGIGARCWDLHRNDVEAYTQRPHDERWRVARKAQQGAA